MCHNFFLMVTFSIILRTSNGIANHAAYFIKNIEDNLCITAGPILDNDSASLFKGGFPLSSNCTYDLKQQWVLKEKVGTQTYRLRSYNSRIFNKQLNATVKGEFINYFPDYIQFIPIQSSNEGETGNIYAIFNPDKNACFESMGENHIIHPTTCQFTSNLSQHWALKLVNQAHAAGTICTSFWSCNQ